jgi:hypothetical protein
VANVELVRSRGSRFGRISRVRRAPQGSLVGFPGAFSSTSSDGRERLFGVKAHVTIHVIAQQSQRRHLQRTSTISRVTEVSFGRMSVVSRVIGVNSVSSGTGASRIS